MKITDVTYGRTFNLGSFESLRVDMKASVDEGEDPQDAVSKLAAEVHLYKAKGGK
jgi:hypothetical protein